jgi:hypothetical protein
MRPSYDARAVLDSGPFVPIRRAHRHPGPSSRRRPRLEGAHASARWGAHAGAGRHSWASFTRGGAHASARRGATRGPVGAPPPGAFRRSFTRRSRGASAGLPARTVSVVRYPQRRGFFGRRSFPRRDSTAARPRWARRRDRDGATATEGRPRPPERDTLPSARRDASPRVRAPRRAPRRRRVSRRRSAPARQAPGRRNE